MNDLSQLRLRALELIRIRFEYVAAVAEADLDSINRVRPPDARYASMRDLTREWEAKAVAVCYFAIDLGIISLEDAKEFLTDSDSRASPGG